MLNKKFKSLLHRLIWNICNWERRINMTQLMNPIWVIKNIWKDQPKKRGKIKVNLRNRSLNSVFLSLIKVHWIWPLIPILIWDLQFSTLSTQDRLIDRLYHTIQIWKMLLKWGLNFWTSWPCKGSEMQIN